VTCLTCLTCLTFSSDNLVGLAGFAVRLLSDKNIRYDNNADIITPNVTPTAIPTFAPVVRLPELFEFVSLDVVVGRYDDTSEVKVNDMVLLDALDALDEAVALNIFTSLAC
jgi:hypothetical protein